MSNFVIQTIQTIAEKLSKLMASTAKAKRIEREEMAKRYFVPHDRYLAHVFSQETEDSAKLPLMEGRARNDLERQLGNELCHQSSGQDTKRSLVSAYNGGQEGGSSDSEQDDDSLPAATREIRRALSLATYLEAQARALLIATLKASAPERLLLQADSNVLQARLAELGMEPPPWAEELKRSIREDDEMEKIKRYRVTYAAMLVAGRKALQLEGDTALAWERRLDWKEGEGKQD